MRAQAGLTFSRCCASTGALGERCRRCSTLSRTVIALLRCSCSTTGSDARARGLDGTTTVMWAAYHGDVELVQRLIAAGADVNAANDYGATALSEAAIIGSTPIVKALLDAGADAKRLSAEGETPLMVVARTGNVESARLLLAAGADINVQEQWGGQSALMWAAAQSQPEMVKFLRRRTAPTRTRVASSAIGSAGSSRSRGRRT